MTAFDPSLWRSLLFVPGARSDRFDKAVAAGADLVCIDLEDAVAPEGKDEARSATLGYLAAKDGRPAPLGLRVNGPDSAWWADDLASLRAAEGVDFVMMPKPTAIAEIDQLCDAFGQDRIIVVMETARSLGMAEAIADHPAVCGAIYGAIDLAGEIGCDLSWEAHLYGRSRCAAAFGAARKVLFDVPYLDVKDPEGLKESTRRAQALGIHARAAIHPAQLGPIHEALAPTAEELAQARRVVEAFEKAKGGVALLDGKLLELPVVKAARRKIAAAERA
ncbi:HpcH/HpaI aldolase/citrate lyase family protein [Parvularcula lutaonensis]|uniref:HpcH/HpaI aldolase/citrate lyase family protein n=1 Tax=Parvularcula lutaonensis TaxID=491923 RepID=A0ABV7MBV0_9PROT|nr:CoA ester lyase [Parvularcula lutaonensis]GGY36495.1 citrate lyase subunit beta [Parvularcula lutaonensis]